MPSVLTGRPAQPPPSQTNRQKWWTPIRCQVSVVRCQVPGARCQVSVGPLGGVAGAAGPIPGVRWSVVSGQWSLVGGDYPASNLYSFSFVVASVLSRWFAMFRNRRRPMIGMSTHSQHPCRDRPRRHKGVDVSQSRCIMVSSRKHHRSVLRYRPDRGRDHVVGADPSQGMAGRVREPRRWRLGAGPSEGSDRAFFAFSVPQGLPGAMVGTSRVSVTNPGIRTLGIIRRYPAKTRTNGQPAT